MEPYLRDADLDLYQGDVLDVLRELPDEAVDCVVTSPPYWGLRDYQAEGQIGLERTPELYVARMVEVFGEVRRVLSRRGTLWLNMGDSYASGNRGWYDEDDEVNSRARGHRRRPRSTGAVKPKDLVGMPWRLALALQADGWYLRADVIWTKPNPMPESVVDRPTKSHEYVFLFARSERYYYDREAVLEAFEARTAGNWSRASHEAREALGRSGTYRRDYRHPVLHAPPQEETLDPSLPPEAPRGADGRRKTTRVEHHDGRMAHEDYANAYGGERWPGEGRNMRSVWTIPVQPYAGAHFAVFPEELPRRCIDAGCPPGGVVLDPFAGSGTVGLVARKLGRRAVLVELSPRYCEMIAERTQQLSLMAEEDVA